MHKSKLIIGIFICLCTLQMQAMINPEIWYRPDSLIVIPQEDSVLWTDEYTIFSVVRSTNNESECLWSFKENDTVAVAVLTNGIYSTKTGTIRSNNARDFSKWCIFSYHSGIILDNNKQYKLCLGEQYVYTDSMAVDTLHSQIEISELAYFKGNVTKLTANTFQTYLALKYGITLDYAPYISQLGDTLWHPVYDEEYYHNVVGIGHDTICNWKNLISTSKENSIIHIKTETLLPDEYILLGDDNGTLSWQQNLDNDYVLQRVWRLRQYGIQQKNITIILNLPDNKINKDSLLLSVLDANKIEQYTITPDSIVHDSLCYFSLNTSETLLQFQFKGKILNEINTILDNSKSSQSDNSYLSDIIYDANNQSIIINGFSENQVFKLYLYDNLGRFITTISSTNPINIRSFPNMISYVEIMKDNQIIGVISIPMVTH